MLKTYVCDCRVLPATSSLLPGLDLPGRAVLYSQYHASVHHQCGPLPESQIPHEVRPQQDTQESHSQDCLRLAALYRYEFTIVPHVLPGQHAIMQTLGYTFFINLNHVTNNQIIFSIKPNNTEL